MKSHTRLYIHDKHAPAEKAVRVEFESENGFHEVILREATREEVFAAVLKDHPVYVAVTDTELVYPYAGYDYREVYTSENDDYFTALGIASAPRYFQEATLVAIPKMKLVQ